MNGTSRERQFQLTRAEAEAMYEQLTSRARRHRAAARIRPILLTTFVIAGSVASFLLLLAVFSPVRTPRTGDSSTQGQSGAIGPLTSARLIVVSGGSDGGIYSFRADGTDGALILSGASIEDIAPSPDGGRIAFVGDGGIFVVDSDGRGQTQLTSGDSDSSPTWSPDGSTLAFSREIPTGSGNADIFTVPADGGQVIQLTDNALPEYNPAWSPDGGRIAFVGYQRVADQPPSNTSLYVMNSDGTGATLLGGTGVVQPTWSPDGSEIAVVQDQGSIVAVASDGSGSRDIYTPPGGSFVVTLSPTWSPDGSDIAFVTGPSVTDLAVYVAAASGGHAEALLGGPDSPQDLAWEPRA